MVIDETLPQEQRPKGMAREPGAVPAASPGLHSGLPVMAVDIAEAAQMIGVCDDTIRRDCNAGEAPKGGKTRKNHIHKAVARSATSIERHATRVKRGGEPRCRVCFPSEGSVSEKLAF